MSEASDGVIQHLVETIDDNPDRLHVDVTPSVRELSALRLPAAKAVLPLMDHANKVTRMRAFRVLGMSSCAIMVGSRGEAMQIRVGMEKCSP